MPSERADAWRARGEYFTWRPSDGADPVEIFHVEAGDEDKPVLLLVHGFPTSSIDWFEIADPLSERFRVCTLDFPGYGFSDKPRGWGYSLQRDAELLEHYLAEVVGAKRATVMSHDRGDSVALILAARAAEGELATGLEHLFLTNGNIFLPLSNLTEAQRMMLDPATAPAVVENVTAELLAAGMGAATFFPPRVPGDPEVEALTATFAHQDGVKVIHETIQYLVERSQDEEAWLGALASSRLPTTVIWGLNDTVSPPRVPSHVWNELLMLKPGRNALYFIPAAGHYLQCDRPRELIAAIEHALDSADDVPPGPLTEDPGAPVLIDRSRERLPKASEVLPPTGA